MQDIIWPKIIHLQVDSVEVESIKSGSVGVEIDSHAQDSDRIWIRNYPLIG